MQCFLFQHSWFLGLSLFERVGLLSKCLFCLFVVVLVDPYDYVFPVPAILWRRSPRPNLAWLVSLGQGDGRLRQTCKKAQTKHTYFWHFFKVCANIRRSILILGHFMPILGIFTLILVFLRAKFSYCYFLGANICVLFMFWLRIGIWGMDRVWGAWLLWMGLGGMDRVRPVVERFSSIEPASVSDVSTDWSGHPTQMKGSGCQTFKC